MLGGDAYPATAIGINLPNANWIRAQHGSKSVTIENITEAYDMASHGNGFNEEFVIDKPTRELMDKYLYITDMLHTDLHECLGHASGRLMPGVDQDALKENGSALEEARADLFALYYLADPKLLELGVIDNPDAYKAEYYKYMLNGLMTQLNRIEPGKTLRRLTCATVSSLLLISSTKAKGQSGRAGKEERQNVRQNQRLQEDARSHSRAVSHYPEHQIDR